MRDVLSSRIPDLAGELVDSAACMYTLTEDHHLYVRVNVVYSACILEGYISCQVN